MARRSGILGGTFNPVHIAHLRLALETAERLRLDRVVLMPAHTPAHKSGSGLLPFDLRVDLLRAAVADSPRLEVTTLEAELPQPSYTWNSLNAWRQRHPGDAPLFILGAEDFAGLDTWHRGLELPEITDFAVMARARSGRKVFCETLRRLWPDAAADGEEDCVRMPGGGWCHFLLMPPLDISASLVRTKWLQGQDIRFLVPDPVLQALGRHHQTVTACWHDDNSITP